MMQNFEQPGQLEQYADSLQKLGQKFASTECVAVDSLNFLYNRLNDGENNPCALMRFFRSMSYQELTPDLQQRTRAMLPEADSKRVNCLTLLASRGMRSYICNVRRKVYRNTTFEKISKSYGRRI